MGVADIAPEITSARRATSSKGPAYVVKGIMPVSQTGVVTWFSPARGYGIVKVDAHDLQTVLVHRTTVENAGYAILKAGEKVVMKIGGGKARRRPFAIDILKVRGAVGRRV